MQVERVRATDKGSRDGELDGRVPAEGVYAPLGEEVLRQLHAAQDLQEDGDGRGVERDVVDGEPGRARSVSGSLGLWLVDLTYTNIYNVRRTKPTSML